MKKQILLILVCSLLLCGCSKKEIDTNEVITINLNKDVYYYVYYELTDENCGGYGYPKNAEKVIDKKYFGKYNDIKSVDYVELLHNKELIEYDTKKEEETKKEWNNLKGPSMGVKDFQAGIKDHNFFISYWYIKLVDKDGNELKEKDDNYNASMQIDNLINEYKNKSYEIISSRNGYRLYGDCDNSNKHIFKLDEVACQSFNLSCDRW